MYVNMDNNNLQDYPIFINSVVVFIFVVIVAMLCLILFGFGITSEWYNHLNKENINSWIIFSALLVALLVSYLSILILPHTHDSIVCLFLIGTFLLLFWVLIFFHYRDIGVSIWVMFAVFVYFFCLSNYVWIISPLAAIPILPLLIMFLFLVYFMIYLADINKVSL